MKLLRNDLTLLHYFLSVVGLRIGFIAIRHTPSKLTFARSTIQFWSGSKNINKTIGTENSNGCSSAHNFTENPFCRKISLKNLAHKPVNCANQEQNTKLSTLISVQLRFGEVGRVIQREIGNNLRITTRVTNLIILHLPPKLFAPLKL